MVLKSHIKSILTLDWSPNGYQLATAGEDNTIRVWDIRAAKCIYSIPAHKSVVTTVKYWHATDSYESKTHDTWALDTDLDIQMDHHTDIDPTSDLSLVGNPLRKHLLDGSFLVSSSYDGTCKLWTDGDYKPLKSLTGLEGRVMSADLSGGLVVLFI